MSSEWETPRLVMFGPYPNGGMPWEQWIVCGITLDLHFAPDGAIEVYADAGDWDRDLRVSRREEAFAWVHRLPTEDQLEALREEMCDG